MKTIKYTAVALALIAAASFTSSAKAAGAGDLILGIYDTTGVVPNSYEVDLGAFSTLSNNEVFDLGSSITSFFAADSSPSLVFNISAAAAGSAAGGLSAKEIAFTASTLPTFSAHTQNTTEYTNITSMDNLFSSGTALTLGSTTSSNGTAISGMNVAAGTGSFQTQIGNNGGSFGLGGTNLLSSYPSSDPISFYTAANSTTQVSAVADGVFVFGGTAGDVTLTYNPAAVPEPSAYALALCAAALFWVLKRRRTVA